MHTNTPIAVIRSLVLGVERGKSCLFSTSFDYKSSLRCKQRESERGIMQSSLTTFLCVQLAYKEGGENGNISPDCL